VSAVTDNPEDPDHHRRPDFDIDTRVASPARLYNFLAGGKRNFDVDRKTAEQVADGMPGGLDTIRAAVHALGDFTARAVRYLVEDAGTRQFLYVGMPVPVGDPVHRIAQRVAPEARVVYVGNDPVVLANARVLLKTDPEGATAYVDGDISDPEGILAQVPATLDLARPIAVLFVGILNHVSDDDHPYTHVARLVDAVSPGSHLVVSHVTGEVMTEEVTSAVKLLNEQPGFVLVPRTRDEVSRFFTGLELVEPGLVLIDRWRPDGGAPASPEGWPAPFYGAVGRKP
jgi:hypothetical protein